MKILYIKIDANHTEVVISYGQVDDSRKTHYSYADSAFLANVFFFRENFRRHNPFLLCVLTLKLGYLKVFSPEHCNISRDLYVITTNSCGEKF